MFKKDVNFNSKESMIAFLKNHFRYYTMNSWNIATSYANNVKLYHLDIPDHLRDKAYDFLDAECDEFNFDIQHMIDEFTHFTGYTAGFNGRSGGYIVLYDTKLETNGNRNCRRTVFNNIDQYADFEDWDIDELRDRVKTVQAFDDLCDEIRESFLFYVEESTIETIEEIKVVTKKVATMPH